VQHFQTRTQPAYQECSNVHPPAWHPLRPVGHRRYGILGIPTVALGKDVLFNSRENVINKLRSFLQFKNFRRGPIGKKRERSRKPMSGLVLVAEHSDCVSNNRNNAKQR